MSGRTFNYPDNDIIGLDEEESKEVKAYIASGGRGVIFPSDDSGVILWVVEKENEPGDWIFAKKSRIDLVAWCENNGLEVVNPEMTEIDKKRFFELFNKREYDDN